LQYNIDRIQYKIFSHSIKKMQLKELLEEASKLRNLISDILGKV